jgi:hypothetical protein
MGHLADHLIALRCSQIQRFAPKAESIHADYEAIYTVFTGGDRHDARVQERLESVCAILGAALRSAAPPREIAELFAQRSGIAIHQTDYEPGREIAPVRREKFLLLGKRERGDLWP